MARRQLGNQALLKEEARDANLHVWLENTLRDLRQAVRGLRKRPVFAVTAIATLAIGIGAVTSLYSVVDAVVLKPVALPAPEELFVLQESRKGRFTNSNGDRLKDWQKLASFTAVTGSYGEFRVWRSPGGGLESLYCSRTFTGAMQVLRPEFALGRAFTPREEAGVEPAVIIRHSLWRNRFDSAPDILEKSLLLSGQPYRVVGVLAPSSGAIDAADAWVPAPADLQNGGRQAGYLEFVARVKPDVPAAQANAELHAAAQRMRIDHPATDDNLDASLIPLREALSNDAREPLLVLLAVVASVLLTICINIASLLLSRSSERQKETAVRSALGASLASLMRLYLSEALLVTAAGGALGLLLAFYGVDFLKSVLPAGINRLEDARIDLRVLGFALGATTLSGLLAGLIPAWIAARAPSLVQESGGSRNTASRQRNLLRAGFVVAEVALSCVLVTTAVRLAESFIEMSKRSLRFATAQTYTVNVPFEWTAPPSRFQGFTKKALERFATLPGVTQVGFVDRLPLSGGSQSGNQLSVQGVPATERVEYGRRAASSGYFTAIGVPLLAGRLFEDKPGRNEVVVNQSFVRTFLQGGEAVGKLISWNKDSLRIVGVIGDIRKEATQAEAQPEVYQYFEDTYWPELAFVIKSSAPLSVLAPAIREEAGRIDGQVLVRSIGAFEDTLAKATRTPRVRSWLVAGFAFLALLLAAIGIHGLIAADVAARWKEFGVRLALGGSIGGLRSLIVWKTAKLVAIGTLLGAAGVYATSKLLESAVGGLEPTRAETALVAGTLLLLPALAAIVWPLYRLAKVDPVSALRHE